MKPKNRVFLLILAVLVLSAGRASAAEGGARAEATELSLNPEFQLIVPNGVIDLAMTDKVANMSLKFISKYDFLNNDFFADVDTRFDLKRTFVGFVFGNKASFDRVFDNNSYFQQLKYVKPYFGYKTGKHTELGTSVSFEDTLTASVDRLVDFDKGKNTLNSVWLTYNTLDRSQPLPKGTAASAELFGSFPDLGSDYEYTMAELRYMRIFQALGKQYVELEMKTGFPFTTVIRPLSQIYLMGGYGSMRGFNHNEFQGDMLKYMQITYRIPLIHDLDMKRTNFGLNLLTIDMLSEFAQIGNVGDFADFDDIKTSFSVGTSYSLFFLKRFRVKFSVYGSKAMADRNPVAYFSLSTYSYLPLSQK